MKLNFKERVLAIVRKIPKGSVMTYRQVAAQAGSPGAARAVGTIMAHNFDPTVPCHRVIKSDGSVGQYNRGGSRAKTQLLIAEGALKKSR
jgi:O-6-methylguanine DNA methyltransferase